MASELDKYDYVAAGVLSALGRFEEDRETRHKVLVDAFAAFRKGADSDALTQPIDLMADGVMALLNDANRDSVENRRIIIADALRAWVSQSEADGGWL